MSLAEALASVTDGRVAVAAASTPPDVSRTPSAPPEPRPTQAADVDDAEADARDDEAHRKERAAKDSVRFTGLLGAPSPRSDQPLQGGAQLLELPPSTAQLSALGGLADVSLDADAVGLAALVRQCAVEGAGLAGLRLLVSPAGRVTSIELSVPDGGPLSECIAEGQAFLVFPAAASPSRVEYRLPAAARAE